MYAAAALRASASQAERIEARKTRMVWDIFPALGVGGGRKLEVAGKGEGGGLHLEAGAPSGSQHAEGGSEGWALWYAGQRRIRVQERRQGQA